MFFRLSYGAMLLLASTALTQPPAAWAQDTDAASGAAEEEDRVLGPVIVRGAFIPDEKRETSEVASLVDAEDFSVRGDSDVASALRRVTGVSLDSGGKFIFVRGLNERYTNSMLNGSVLPSPEPLRKVAPLDLFPTSVLSSTLVQKTFSPEMSAEFGGGILDIRTKAVPDAPFFEVGVSTGGDSETTSQDGFLYDGGDTDYLGYDDGVRDLSGELATALADGTYSGLPLADRSALSRALTDNSSLLVVQEGYVGPDFGIDLAGGHRIDYSDAISVGLLGSLSYSNEWSTRDGVQSVSEAALTAGEPVGDIFTLARFNRRSTTNTVNVNGLASLGFDILDNHEVKFLAFGTRSTDKEAEVTEGFTNDERELGSDPDSPPSVRKENLDWIERQLWTTQVQGEHIFPDFMDLEVNWRGSYSEASRDAPYSLVTEYDRSSETADFRLRRGSGIEISEIEDDTTDFGIDFLLPFYLGDREINLKAGYAYSEKDRESQNDFLVAQDFDAPFQRVDFAYQAQFAADDEALQAVRSNQSPAFYVATQEVDAGYIGVDAELTPFMRIALGGRYEDFIQVVETRAARNTPGIITPPLEDDQFYPAATLTWNFAEDLQLRMGYSETVNRPQFREIGPSRFTNTVTNEQLIGNPFLETTELTNYDARLEWYFGRDQFLTAGLFYKDITSPIEAFNVGSGESLLVSFVNIDAAEVQGVELEYQQVLPVQNWFDGEWFANKEFRITTNYTYSDSSIEFDDEVIILDQAGATQLANIVGSLEDTALLEITRDGNNLIGFLSGLSPDTGVRVGADREITFDKDRQLQGQSEHLANFQIGYTDDVTGSNLNLLVNFQSERIRSVESFIADAPAVIEEPPVTVDIVYKRDFDAFGGDYQLGMKLQNILGDEYRAYQEGNGGQVDADTYDLGTSFSVSLKRRF